MVDIAEPDTRAHWGKEHRVSEFFSRPEPHHVKISAVGPEFGAAAASFSVNPLPTSGSNTSSIISLEHILVKRRLTQLLLGDYFGADGPGSFEIAIVCETSRVRAADLISLIGSDRTLPRIAVDGEGDFILIWGKPANLLVTVEGDILHAVESPGTDKARHIDSLKFSGRAIPSEVYRLIPRR